MTKFLQKYSMAIGAFMVMGIVGISNFVNAAAVDYASTTQAVDDATSGLGSTLISGSLKVIGIALGVWALFFLVGKLRKHTK